MVYDLDIELRKALPLDIYLKLISDRQLLFEFNFAEPDPTQSVPFDIQRFYKSKASYTKIS